MTEALKAKLRKSTGSSDSKKLRASGRIPAVVYGHHSEPKSVEIDLKDVNHLLMDHGIGATVDVEIEGETVMTMVKDVQKNLFKNEILHLDLQELTKGESVKVTVPLHFINKESVEDSVMMVVEQVHSVDIEVLPKDLVESFDVDVSVLKDKSVIMLEELSLFSDARYTIFADGDTIVASLTQGGVSETAETESGELESIVSEVVDEAPVE